jgi:hypothetical protein
MLTRLNKPFSTKLALGIFIAWALFISFEFWGFGPASYVKIPDAADHILATRLAIEHNIADNENGNWTADQLVGTDRFAQADSLGVLDGLFVLLPDWLAYGFLMFLQRFVAGFFMYLLFHRQLRVSSLVSQNQINGQFEGFTVYDSLVMPGVPLILYALGLLVQRKERAFTWGVVYAFLIGLVFANISAFLFSLFIFPLILIWLLAILPLHRRNSLVIFGAFLVGWFSLEIFSLFATYYFSGYSQRVYRDSCIGPGSVFDIPNALSLIVFKPSNALFLLAGFFGLIVERQKETRNRIAAVLVLVVGYFLLSQYFPGFACGPYNVFGIPRGLNYSRFHIYIPFLIAVFAGLGLQSAVTFIGAVKRQQVQYLAPVLIGFLLLLPIWMDVQIKQATFAARTAGSNFANVFGNPYLEFLAAQINNSDEHYRAAAVYDAEAQFPLNTGFLWAYGINTIDGYTRLYTAQFSEFWEMVVSPTTVIFPECRYVLKIRDGNNRVPLSTACEVPQRLDASQVGHWFRLDLLSLANTKYFVSTKEITERSFVEIDTSAVECPETIPGCTKYYIYENKLAFPFVFSVRDVFIAPDHGKVIGRMRNKELDFLSTTAVVNEEDVLELPLVRLQGPPADLNIEEYSSDYVRISFTSEFAKIVVLNWAYTPDWTVWVDGEQERVFPVDLLLMGVYVPDGQHLIEFRYQPKYTPAYIANYILKQLR